MGVTGVELLGGVTGAGEELFGALGAPVAVVVDVVSLLSSVVELTVPPPLEVEQAANHSGTQTTRRED